MSVLFIASPISPGDACSIYYLLLRATLPRDGAVPTLAATDLVRPWNLCPASRMPRRRLFLVFCVCDLEFGICQALCLIIYLSFCYCACVLVFVFLFAGVITAWKRSCRPGNISKMATSTVQLSSIVQTSEHWRTSHSSPRCVSPPPRDERERPTRKVRTPPHHSKTR